MCLTRPFRNAHVALPVALLFGAEYLVLHSFYGCGQKHPAALAMFVTAIACLAGWLAHLRVGPLNGWRVVLRFVGEVWADLTRFFIAVIAVSILLLLVSGNGGGCYTGRFKVAEMIGDSKPAMEEIARRYATRKTVHGIGAGLQIKLSGADTHSMVTQDGVIVLFRGDFPSVVVMTPNPGTDGMHWHCSGTPQKNLPAICRD